MAKPVPVVKLSDKLTGDELKMLKYREAIEQVHTYNSKLLLDRRLRIPYIDSQTGLAQQDCHLWVSRVQRCPPIRAGQIYSYPSRRWRCLKRPDFTGINKQAQQIKKEADKETTPTSQLCQDENSVGGELSQEQSIDDTTVVQEASGSAVEGASFDGGAMPVAAQKYDVYEDYYDEFESDYDSGEEFGTRKKKRKVTKKSKKNAMALKLANQIKLFTREELSLMSNEERKKPYNCQICGKRYKNNQGLRYHYEHYNHDTGEESAAMITAEVSSEGIDPDQPPVKRKKGSQPSSYCDFCLGDTEENKKSGSSEELISCSDCGRSGHPSCLQFSETLIEEVKKYRWQCIECKCCCLCGTSENDDQLLFCDDCDRGYHMYCLKPPIDEPPEGSWSCQLCAARISGEDINKVAVLPQHMNIVKPPPSDEDERKVEEDVPSAEEQKEQKDVVEDSIEPPAKVEREEEETAF